MPIDRNIKLYRILYPLSFLYEIGVRVRNRLFDWGIIPSERFNIPVISIGNLAVGGTGKTPHTEYIIRLLQDRYRIAVLSRGYKRKSTGFVLANAQSTCNEIGDEPYQMKRRYPHILVAVDAKRSRGIRNLLALPEEIRPEVILLDDAYQHRYVRPTLHLLLTDFHRPYYLDKLLPVGRLREPSRGIKRADVVIVTKCDPEMQPSDFDRMEKEMNLDTCQKLFYSRIVYGDLEPVFEGEAPKYSLAALRKEEEVLLVSGIAHPEYFVAEIKKQTNRATALLFPDHHAFGNTDIQKIKTAFDRMDSSGKRIIVTEKDAARLRDNPLIPPEWRQRMYLLPITIDFCQDRKKEFNDLINKHIIATTSI